MPPIYFMINDYDYNMPMHKEIVHPKVKSLSHLLTLMSFKMCMTFFYLWSLCVEYKRIYLYNCFYISH